MWVSNVNFQRQLFLDTQSCYVTCCVLFADKGKKIHVMITIFIHSWLNFCILYYLVEIQDSGSQYSMVQGNCWSSWLWYFQECYWLDICTVYLLVRFSLPCYVHVHLQSLSVWPQAYHPLFVLLSCDSWILIINGRFGCVQRILWIR